MTKTISFFPSMEGATEAITEFCNRPTIEVKETVVVPPDAQCKLSRLIIRYRENNGDERDQELIDEHKELERVKGLAQQIAEDPRSNANIPALLGLKNNEQRRVFLLELHNITGRDSETVMALLNLGIVK